MKSLVVSIAFVAACLGFAPFAAAQAAPTPEQLIDQLTQIDCNAPELYPHEPYPDFWAALPESDLRDHVDGRVPDCVPEAMRALVRLGPQALPALVRHIDDARPTELKIGYHLDPDRQFIGGQFFATEYESRAHIYHGALVPYPTPFVDACKDDECITVRGFEEPYTIKVGDVVFALIGQIVNRYMVAARYQMTLLVLVNSPIETPTLAAKVRADWTGVDAEGLKASLLADLRMPLRPPPRETVKRLIRDEMTPEQHEAEALETVYAGALRRLRFYYPEVYASLSGADLAKRQAFEQREADEAARERSYPQPSAESFIDQLTTLNCPIPGVSRLAIAPEFLGEFGSLARFSETEFEGHGKLRYPASCNDIAASNLVHDGAMALPVLLRHLDDRRPTKLVVGRDVRLKPYLTDGQFFADEYDARQHAWPFPACGADRDCTTKRSFEKPYRVKVADVCLVLIGQIVNRRLNAVRFQPPASVMVNSPIETPGLAARVRADWGGVDGEGLKASLLADIRADTPPGAPDAEVVAPRDVQWGALRRLRYFYPDAYASLAGADLAKRAAFEHAERHPGPELPAWR